MYAITDVIQQTGFIYEDKMKSFFLNLHTISVHICL